MTAAEAIRSAADLPPADAALCLARAGLFVLPCKPLDDPSDPKGPYTAHGFLDATNDVEQIRSWWARHPKALVGLWPGPSCLVVFDCDRKAGPDGAELFSDLGHTLGVDLADTFTVTTPSGGEHRYFTVPEDVVVRNVPGERLLQVKRALDVRSSSGYVIAPSSGSGYVPTDDEVRVRAMPGPLLQLLRSVEDRPRQASPSTTTSTDRTRSAFNDRHSVDKFLERAGWVEARASGGLRHFTRPGKRSGKSASLYSDGILVVWSSNASPFDERESVDAFSAFAQIVHGGDWGAARRVVREMYPDEARADTAAHNAASNVSLSSLIAPRPTPAAPVPAPPTDVRRRLNIIEWSEFWKAERPEEDWVLWPVLPARRSAVLYAPGKTGKSLVLLQIIVKAITGNDSLDGIKRAPRRVLYLDYEMTQDDLYERLEAFGLGPSTDLGLLEYASLPSLPPLDTAEGGAVLVDAVEQLGIEAVIVDTTGRAVAGEENSADTFRAFYRYTGGPLKARGVAWARVDHSGKEKDRGQRGSSAKNDDVDLVCRLDRVQGGWKLTTTHQRIPWAVPELALAEVDRNGFTSIEAATSTAYVPGTAELVARMRALGLDHTSTKAAALTALRQSEEGGVKAARVVDALRWMRTEATPNLAELALRARGNHAGNHDFEGPRNRHWEPTEKQPLTSGNHDGNHREPHSAVNGNQVPPLTGEPGSHGTENQDEAPTENICAGTF